MLSSFSCGKPFVPIYVYSPRPSLFQEQPAQIVAMVIRGKSPYLQISKPKLTKEGSKQVLWRNERQLEGPQRCQEHMEAGSCPEHLIDGALMSEKWLLA